MESKSAHGRLASFAEKGGHASVVLGLRLVAGDGVSAAGGGLGGISGLGTMALGGNSEGGNVKGAAVDSVGLGLILSEESEEEDWDDLFDKVRVMAGMMRCFGSVQQWG